MRKPFENLTDNEILALTEEDIAHYVDLACAEAGVPLLPPDPGPSPDLPPAPAPDLVMWQVSSETFEDREHAQAFADAGNKGQRLRLDLDYNTYCRMASGELATTLEVSRIEVYGTRTWDAAKLAVVARNNAKQAHAEARANFARAAVERRDVAATVTGRVAQAQADQRNRDWCGAELRRYVELANGDEAVARRFLLRARPDVEKYLSPVKAANGAFADTSASAEVAAQQ